MKIIHPWRDSYIKALEKRGIFNRNSGIRVAHTYKIPEGQKFNAVAAKGGTLCELLTHERMPLYVDRIHGGTYYHRYEFDHELMHFYRELLGDEFLGLSIHELGNVRQLDWARIRNNVGHPQPWTEEEVIESVRRVSKDKKFIHLSCGSAAEYVSTQQPHDYESLVRDFEQLILLRKKEQDGFCFPCEGGPVTTKLHLENGAKVVFSEQGAQTKNLRVQTAYARGMSRAYGVKWGVFYEPWGGEPCTAPYFVEDELCEWHSSKSNTNALYKAFSDGFGGGSSRSLQRRIGLYALTSGADYYAEEWELGNVFTRIDTAELSPYGEIHREVARLSASAGEIHDVTKVAFVLPREMAFFDTGLIPSDMGGRFATQPVLPWIQEVADTLSPFFSYSGTTSCGNEAHVMKNSDLPDCFDILHEDAPRAVLDSYAFLVDVTLENRLHSYDGPAKVLHGTPVDIYTALQKGLKAELGFSMSGELIVQPYTEDNIACIGLYNGDGIQRTWQDGDKRMSEGTHTVTLAFEDNVSLSTEYLSASDIQIEQDGKMWRFTLPAGECCLLKTNRPAQMWMH